MPVFASEDFAFYLKEKPGAFFFLGSAHKENDLFLHSPNFNFNEKLIDLGGRFWLKLALDRIFSEWKKYNTDWVINKLKYHSRGFL